ncbi:MAG: DUF2269 family protein [Chloroflexota bacterium]
MNWFPILLIVHVTLAVALLLPSVLLPFVLRRGEREPGPATRALMATQRSGTLIIAAGLALTGTAMLLILGPELITQPWLMVALALYAINLIVATVIGRPNLRRLIGLSRMDTDDDTWRRRATQQRYVAYGMAGLVGVIGFLMSTKPALW